MRRLLISTTALSVALSPVASFPTYAQTLTEDGSVIGPDGAVLCTPSEGAPCDLAAIVAELAAAEAERAAAEAEGAAEVEAHSAADADAAALVEAEARAAAAAAAAEAEAAAAAATAEGAGEAEAAAAEAVAAAAAEQAAAAEAAAAEAAVAEALAAEAAAQAEAADAAAAAAAEEAAAAEAAAAETAAQIEAEAAAQAEAEAEAEAAAQAEAEAQAVAQAATEEVAAQAEAETQAAAEAAQGADEGMAAEAEGIVADPEAVAAAIEELTTDEDGGFVDPAAGLKVAESEPTEDVVPVDAPTVSEGEFEGLAEVLTADPTALDPAAIAAAALAGAASEGGAEALPEADPDVLVGAVTETITDDSRRTSAEEFAAAPVTVAPGRKNKLSDLERAGLFVLGALAIGSVIKSANAQQTESRVVSNTGDRVVVLQPDGTYRVLKDDDTIIRQPGSTVRTETFRDGSTRTIVERADGTQVVTIRDATGRVLRRATYDQDGREIVLIDDLAEEEPVIVSQLPEPRGIVISSRDQDAALKRELARIEAEKAGRKFSLRQIRDITQVRALAATIDVEPVTFASGSAAVTASEARNLADLGEVMQNLLAENPREVFLVMGHTDATGKAAMNLALSDRRAESVALALTEYFDIPPENMVVQGYGETELLIDTLENEPRNRRVEVKVITPLMRRADLR